MSNTEKAEKIKTTKAELILDAKAILGEGAIWADAEKKLLWIDIEGRKFNLFDPDTGNNTEIELKSRPGTVVPLRKGQVIIAMQDGIHQMDLLTGRQTFLVNPERDKPDNRLNDGKCDPAGRFWVGSVNLYKKEGEASLYRIEPDGFVSKVLRDLTISNGIIWSLDYKKMYFIDTPTQSIFQFDYDLQTGKISSQKTIVEIDKQDGSPDGMTIDSEGKLWVAHYKGSSVVRWDPETGEMLEKVVLPVPHVTSCAFGGENLDTLYITTARDGLTPNEEKEYPLSGGIFAAKPGVRGISSYSFGESL